MAEDGWFWERVGSDGVGRRGDRVKFSLAVVSRSDWHLFPLYFSLSIPRRCNVETLESKASLPFHRTRPPTKSRLNLRRSTRRLPSRVRSRLLRHRPYPKRAMEGETLSACAYTLHLPPTSSSLQPFLPSLKAFLSTLSAPYIFHHPTPFANLSLSPLAFSASAQQYRWIEGTTDCADAVDDEWFLVWLLREVTRVWEDVVVGVADEDGEFLLIEGAEELPRWVTPGNAENRVSSSHAPLQLLLDPRS